MPTRIAFCITELDPGGAEWALVRLIEHLDRAEWEPRVDCLGPRAPLVAEFERLGVPVTCHNGTGLGSSFRVYRQLARTWREWRPQIVQTSLFHANLLGRLAARRAGVPVVCSGLRVAERRNRWHGRLDRLTNFLVDRNVCVSRGVADWAEHEVGLLPAKTVVIPNGVDVERFAGAAPADLTGLGIPPGSRVILGIGRLDPQKSFDDLLTAFAGLAPRHNTAHLLIVGEGRLRGALEATRDTLALSDRIHLPGRQDDIPGLLAASEIFVLASRWEGMPNVVLEAMAAGKSIVSTTVEGIRELLLEGESGLLVPPESPVQLQRAIERFLSDSQLAHTCSHNAQTTAVSRFTKFTPAAATAALYRQVLADKLSAGAKPAS
ncbi:glycosyltransferase [Planctellipticum variicoloris]|uniref:glycosyltransferase n=1 Tax=Planctellipticum variicoloris TaxID=3064265 RepID=UPI003013542B|nr:glycosyltransferase [Planctomycetaceae bacterium SH412]